MFISPAEYERVGDELFSGLTILQALPALLLQLTNT